MPVLETTVGGVLREAAERAAGTIALVEGTADATSRRRWSYADLLTDAERVARALLGRFDPGERVAVWAPNSRGVAADGVRGGAGGPDPGDR